MNPLDELEAARGGTFRYRVGGVVYTAPDPVRLSLPVLFQMLQVPVPVPDDLAMPLWQREALTQRWRAHYDLPEVGQAQRLMYVVNRYRDDLDYDLRTHAGVDLGEWWRARRWRTLLATIDRLPQFSYYAEAVSLDPEHARMIAESLAARRDQNPDEESETGPPLRTWTPEVRLLTDIFDAVRSLQHTTVAINAPRGKAGDGPKPSPRPKSLLAGETKRAEFARRRAAHQSLADRVLGRKG
jgi:hypothetical protein